MLAMILRSFHIELQPGQDHVPDIAITLRYLIGFLCMFSMDKRNICIIDQNTQCGLKYRHEIESWWEATSNKLNFIDIVVHNVVKLMLPLRYERKNKLKNSFFFLLTLLWLLYCKKLYCKIPLPFGVGWRHKRYKKLCTQLEMFLSQLKLNSRCLVRIEDYSEGYLLATRTMFQYHSPLTSLRSRIGFFDTMWELVNQLKCHSLCTTASHMSVVLGDTLISKLFLALRARALTIAVSLN